MLLKGTKLTLKQSYRGVVLPKKILIFPLSGIDSGVFLSPKLIELNFTLVDGLGGGELPPPPL